MFHLSVKTQECLHVFSLYPAFQELDLELPSQCSQVSYDPQVYQGSDPAVPNGCSQVHYNHQAYQEPEGLLPPYVKSPLPDFPSTSPTRSPNSQSMLLSMEPIPQPCDIRTHQSHFMVAFKGIIHMENDDPPPACRICPSFRRLGRTGTLDGWTADLWRFRILRKLLLQTYDADSAAPCCDNHMDGILENLLALLHYYTLCP